MFCLKQLLHYTTPESPSTKQLIIKGNVVIKIDTFGYGDYSNPVIDLKSEAVSDLTSMLR
jgi:hypothetical protein